MEKNNNICIAIDGHDGSGKTTLARSLADAIDGIYVRPFEGDIGILLIEAADKKDADLTLKIGKDAIQRINGNYKNRILIFDRHWMTVLSLVDEKFWRCWPFFPPTILCWADLRTTKERLNKRPERKYNDSYHETYLNIYMKLAEDFKTCIINTGNRSIGQCLKDISHWIDDHKILK